MHARPQPIAGLEYPQQPDGPALVAAKRMIDSLREQNRLTIEDEPLAEALFKYADVLDTAAGGRGASIALVGAQFTATWEKLKALQAPVEAGGEEYDVVLLPVISDAS